LLRLCHGRSRSDGLVSGPQGNFIKKVVIAGLAVGAFIVPAAADMPYTNAPPPIPDYSWTGCYVGANIGYAWGNSNVTYTQTGAFLTAANPANVAFSNSLGSPNISMNGLAGGGQIGCNYQIARFVFGLEGDGESVGLSGIAGASGTLPVGGSPASSSTLVSSHALFTLRPRAGFAVDRTLFYVTGGYAAGILDYSETFTHLATNSVEAGTVSSTRSGWSVGAGIEYAMTNNWTIKGEYLYVNLGSVSFATANNLFPTFTSANNATLKENVVRLGLNYKF
jgi:outer membrane immunogenic protein